MTHYMPISDTHICHMCVTRYIDARCANCAEPQSSTAAADAASDATSCVAIFTVGQVALLRAAKPPSALTLLLQTLTAHRFLPSAAAAGGGSGAGGASQLGSSQADCSSSQQPPDAAGAAASQAAEREQHEQAGEQGAAGTSTAVGGAGGGGRPVPAGVQAHAWIALGKVCLVDEGLAKKVVPLFVQVRRRLGGGLHSWQPQGAVCCMLRA